MQIKLKKENSDGIVRVETSGEIMEVLVNENMIRPDKETFSLCFRGKNSSGIVILTKEELTNLCKTAKKDSGLIKEVKIWD